MQLVHHVHQFLGPLGKVCLPVNGEVADKGGRKRASGAGMLSLWTWDLIMSLQMDWRRLLIGLLTGLNLQIELGICS